MALPRSRGHPGPTREGSPPRGAPGRARRDAACAVHGGEARRARGLGKGRHDEGVKILGDGALTKSLTGHATEFSGSAAEKIAAAGGTAVVV